MEADPGAFLKRLPVFLPLLHQCLEDGRLGAVRVNRDGVKLPDGADGSEERMEEEGGNEEEGGRGDEGSLLAPERRLEPEGASEGVDLGREGGVGEAGTQNRVRDVDHLLFSSLLTLNKMCVECELTGCNSSLPQDMHAIWGERKVKGMVP